MLELHRQLSSMRIDVMGIQLEGPGDAANGGDSCVHSAYMYCDSRCTDHSISGLWVEGSLCNQLCISLPCTARPKYKAEQQRQRRAQRWTA